jgi:tetratricopeptide (TPR) repeat protein
MSGSKTERFMQISRARSLRKSLRKHHGSEEERMVEHQQSFPHPKEQWLIEETRLFALKQYEKALATYEQAIQLDPTSVVASTGKGNALSELKRYAEALATYEQALQLDPTYARAYVYKARVLFRLRRYKEALGAVKQAYRRANQFGTLTDVNF